MGGGGGGEGGRGKRLTRRSKRQDRKIDSIGGWDKERGDTRVEALFQKAKSRRNSVKREGNCEMKRKNPPKPVMY